MKTVAVFGGSAPRPGSAAYDEALAAGRQLAEAGYAVVTGGYVGVMEAASRGAAEAGGHVVGVTCGLIERWREGLAANAWVKEEIRYATLRERLYHLVERCDAAIALGGGVGTLSEIALTWSLMQTGEIQPKPLIAVGPIWRESLGRFVELADGYIPTRDRNLLQLAATVDEAVELVSRVVR